MKKVLCLCVSILLLLGCIFSAIAETEEKPTEGSDASKTEVVIKGHRFGDSMESVIKTEGEPVGDGVMTGNTANYIYYDSSVAGLKAMLIYYFADDKLCEFRYVLQESHSNDSVYIDDYYKLKDALASKYEEHELFKSLSNESWDTDSHKKNYSDEKGKALSYGYLKYRTYFIAKDAEISLQMSADNYNVSTVLSYYSTVIEKSEPNYDDEL